jgi:hypothetical protein
MNDLTHFERAVMQRLLDGEDEFLSILREQLQKTVVAKREMTGVGFYTTFLVSDEARRLPGNQSFKFGDVIAKMPGLNSGAGFLLYVQDGALHMLEGYTYDEPWPEPISAFELSYTKGHQRDVNNLYKMLHG